MVLSLQGPMAVGKTTACRYAEKHRKDLYVSYEDTAPIIDEVRRRNLKQNEHDDYLEIQRIWIRAMIDRYRQAEKHSLSLMDYGPEEIEFHTIFYPRSIGKNWEIETELKNELKELRACKVSSILFLDATEPELRRRKEGDETRSRESFDRFLGNMLDLKRKWFKGRSDTNIMFTDGMRPEDIGLMVCTWVDMMRMMDSSNLKF